MRLRRRPRRGARRAGGRRTAPRVRPRLGGGRPAAAPPFPSAGPAPAEKPGFAGRLPAVWKVPPRNPRFTGRDGMLTQLRRRVHSGEGRLVVQALYGLGGVGKTQLAIEYAHRFAADYDLVWWIDAEQPGRVPGQPHPLAPRGGPPPAALGGTCRPAPRWLTPATGCWPSCAAGTGGCWSSTAPNPLRTSPTTGPAGPGRC